MISPGGIPQITGDLDGCYSHGFMVSVLGSRFSDTGSAVMQAWSGLAGVYQAPESEILLQAMIPVAFTAAGVGTDLNTTGSAIMGYATAVRPIQARLRALVVEATTFVDYANANSNWNTDQGRVDHDNAMLAEVNDLMAQWEAAQRACANTIDGLYGGTRYVVNNGDSTASTNEFGLTKDQWGSVGAGDQGVSWGTSAERDKPWYEDTADAVGGFFVGAWHGLTGMVTGLGGLVGFQGWGVMGQSWKGLGELVLVLSPGGVVLSALNEVTALPGLAKGELQNTVTGMGKSLVAWDQWSKDPAQAAGESVFNIATFFIPVGGAAAGTAKAVSLVGKAAEVVGVAGKVAKVADVLKVSRVADVVAGVRVTLDLHLNNAADALHKVLGGQKLAFDTPGRLHLPEVVVPHAPDLHATTVHPDTPLTPHPAGPPASHSGAGHGTGAGEAPAQPAAVHPAPPVHTNAHDSTGAIQATPGDPVSTLADRVHGGLQDVLHDPRTAGQFPPGADPLHGMTPQQYFDKFGAGTHFSDGSPQWDWASQAPNNGAKVGTEVAVTLHQGEILDRYGPPRGKFLSPVSTPYAERALPGESVGQGYHEYEVVKPLPVVRSVVEKAFGEPGGGFQYLLDRPLSWYLDPANGPYLREVLP